MYAKVADNWHPLWWEMLFQQEGKCKMEHAKGKVKIVDGIMLYISFVDADELLCEIPYEYMEDFGITEKELKANANRLLECWNGWDELQAQLKQNKFLMEHGTAVLVEDLTKQRDALLEACELAVTVIPAQQAALVGIAQGIGEATGEKLEIPKLPPMNVFIQAIALCSK